MSLLRKSVLLPVDTYVAQEQTTLRYYALGSQSFGGHDSMILKKKNLMKVIIDSPEKYVE